MGDVIDVDFGKEVKELKAHVAGLVQRGLLEIGGVDRKDIAERVAAPVSEVDDVPDHHRLPAHGAAAHAWATLGRVDQ